MKTYKIYLIRHGVTQSNLEGKYIGATDHPLCPEGEKELTVLAEKREYPNVGRVYSSPLKRCIQTANILYPFHTPVVLDQLKELDFGLFEDKSIDQLAQLPEYIEWLEGNQLTDVQGAENRTEFLHRIADCFEEIVAQIMKDNITHSAVITHAGVLSTLLSVYGLPAHPPTTWQSQSGTGYTLVVNSALWSNNKKCEIFCQVPFDNEVPTE